MNLSRLPLKELAPLAPGYRPAIFLNPRRTIHHLQRTALPHRMKPYPIVYTIVVEIMFLCKNGFTWKGLC